MLLHDDDAIAVGVGGGYPAILCYDHDHDGHYELCDDLSISSRRNEIRSNNEEDIFSEGSVCIYWRTACFLGLVARRSGHGGHGIAAPLVDFGKEITIPILSAAAARPRRPSNDDVFVVRRGGVSTVTSRNTFYVRERTFRSVPKIQLCR